jgi:hypothetical protein
VPKTAYIAPTMTSAGLIALTLLSSLLLAGLLLRGRAH